LENLGGKNLYGFVINNSLNQVDLFGLVGCTLSYSFDDDDSWWEKPLYPINTKWLKTFDEIKKDIKEQLKTCCCIKKIYFTQHNGVPGTLVIGSGQLSAKELQIIFSAINDAKRRIIIERNKKELDFLKFVKTFMCKWR